MLTLAVKPTVTSDPDARPHAVVIGAGFGGLAAAVRLGARGYRVTVLERLDQPGGRARVHRQDGFTFDAGPTIVTAPFLFEELWRLCGREMREDVTLVPMQPFYRIRFEDGQSFAYSGDRAAMRAEVARFSPDDVPGYERFMAHSEAVCRMGFEELGHVPFGSLGSMLRIAPDLLRLSGHRSVYDVVSRFIRDERLRTIFSFHPLLIGGNPFRASGIYCLIAHLERQWGVHFAMGGTGRLVDGLCGLIRGQGGRVRCGEEVSRIRVEDARATGVVLSGGEVIPADIVVSNADSAFTYGTLLGGRTRRWSARRLARASSSMGLFVWYFGTRKKYPEVDHHMILMGPRYRGLLQDIFDRKHLADDFSLYLHRPTATDPLLAPPGHDAFYVLAPVPNLDGGQDWAQLAEPYRQRIARFLEGSVLPGLSDALVTSRVTTPQDFSDDFLSFRGSGFGLEPVLTQSAWFRPHNRSEDVANLFLVGAGTHPGAGLPGVLSSARVLDSVVPDARVCA
ncbi:UNVERIFIED_ORG: phytoene desaturase [Methylobacterium sp. SuP10 SLI 274]|uniref:phytoene desaturase n=1 Tax=Methylorubrum extorquens TaxID=408 RepID=UPI0020A1E643|nr:phytoene desaturase [Methylorubrum extorquens]MDF9864754.1 phytoene desaturase [Methylorubrum pseudosasae]MDH6638335.1 phytoene desaturase [Methylobacterium sp. SuP10 SLI 274]MDH6667518.1 phytoene desaturase [Methylorubrum zatmanii]MCP1559415.1 phytoene desaturase [Methylorubrum extorquens]MDF9793057.1 phytoene desaturase [Methylorubrum extorquens]